MSRLEKAIELFGDMQAKHGCHFKQWCHFHLTKFHDSIIESDADEYDVVEKVLFPFYGGFEGLLDDFIIEYCQDRDYEVEISEEVMNKFIERLEIKSCLQRYRLLSLSPEN